MNVTASLTSTLPHPDLSLAERPMETPAQSPMQGNCSWKENGLKLAKMDSDGSLPPSSLRSGVRITLLAVTRCGNTSPIRSAANLACFCNPMLADSFYLPIAAALLFHFAEARTAEANSNCNRLSRKASDATKQHSVTEAPPLHRFGARLVSGRPRIIVASEDHCCRRTCTAWPSCRCIIWASNATGGKEHGHQERIPRRAYRARD